MLADGGSSSALPAGATGEMGFPGCGDSLAV